MRIRSIKPEFCTDEKIGALSREARMHFVLLWMAADRHGTVEYRPRQLAAMLYPFDDDMLNERFEALTSEVLQQSLCSRFAANGRYYLHITNFEKHQALTTWERKESRVLIQPKELRKYCGSAAEVLRSEERRGEERIEPPNPHVGLSEWSELLQVLSGSGKCPVSVRAEDLALYWRNIENPPPANDPELLEYIRAELNGLTGRVGTLAPWLSKVVPRFSKKIKTASTDIHVGPPRGEM